jgi:molybdenum cofactor biosynthesis enzyme MoaA
VQTAIVTNGTLLGNVLDDLAGSVSWVRVSLDAATPETYERLRPARGGRNKFSLVAGNIASAVAMKAFKVGISYVVSPGSPEDPLDNIGEMSTSAELAVQLGCDYLEFKAELEPNHSIRAAEQPVRARIEEQIELARQTIIDSRVRIMVSSSLTALLRGSIAQPKNYHWCPATMLRTTISPSGVFVCAYHRGQSQFRIGDVQHTSFAEVWRQMDHHVVDPAVDCGFHCARHESNLAVFNGVPVAENATDATDWFI